MSTWQDESCSFCGGDYAMTGGKLFCLSCHKAPPPPPPQDPEKAP
jgi:hypothetical protein